MTCKICKHAEHEPGRCEQCNCGESDIKHVTGYKVATRIKEEPFHRTESAFINKRDSKG